MTKLLEKLTEIIKEITALGILVEDSQIINGGTSFEIYVNKNENSLEKIKKIKNFCGLVYDGYYEKEESYRLIFCQKTIEQELRDKLQSHLINLGFLVKEIYETSPNKGFLFIVEVNDESNLKKLSNFNNLIFEGYTKRKDVFDLFFIFPIEG